MPAIKNLSKKDIIKGAIKLINDKGWDMLNARSLAASLEISTKPLYRIYTNMDEIKNDVYEEISNLYDAYLKKKIENQDAVLSLCIGYVEFAQEYKNLFISLFLKNNLRWKSIENVFDEKWNQSIIINLVNKHGYSFKEAKDLFMNLWLYANGLATLIATNDIVVDKNEICERLTVIYKVFKKDE